MAHLEELFLDTCRAVIEEDISIWDTYDFTSDSAKLLLPSYVGAVVQLSGAVFSNYRLKVKADTTGYYQCKVSLFYQTEDGYTLLGATEGRGPAALNLAYMRAVTLLADEEVRCRIVLAQKQAVEAD